MKVQIAFATHEFDKNLVYIRRIAQTVRSNSGTIILENYEAANARINSGSGSKNNLDWDAILQTHMRAFEEADLFIIEGSSYSFSNGFWSALSLVRQKPTLFLYQKQSEKLQDFNTKFLSGLLSDNYSVKTYENEDDLEKIVSDFILEFDLPKKKINIEIDQATDSYLDKVSKTTGRQKSEIIKDLLNREVRKEKTF